MLTEPARDASRLLRGDIVWSGADRRLRCVEQGWLALEQGRVAGVFAAGAELPPPLAALPREDFGRCLLLPGLTDLHVHAPQYAFRGLGMDLPLLPWLEQCAFPEEERYADPGYAAAAYGRFAHDLLRSCTTRAVVFATCHSAAATLLADALDKSGLAALVGRVSMDRGATDALNEGPTAAADERAWLAGELAAARKRVRPIVTPRFAPSCTDGLLRELGHMAQDFDLPVQSHLSENRDELRLVAELFPHSAGYADVYDSCGLLTERTVLAHCVYCRDDELQLLKQRGVTVAHCPQSNINLVSGAAPVRDMLQRGLNVGLGTDIGGGAHLSLLRAMQDAVAVSKLRCSLLGESGPLTVGEAFYLASRGGGSFFGPVGAFEPGWRGDVLALNDSALERDGFTLEQRLQRAIYLLDETALAAKYVDGERLF